MKKTTVDKKSLPEVVRLMSDASGATITLSPEIEKCIAEKKLGCDWVITTSDWDGQTLKSVLETLTDCANLAYRVVSSNTVLITRRAGKPSPR